MTQTNDTLEPCPLCASYITEETGYSDNFGNRPYQYASCSECSYQADIADHRRLAALRASTDAAAVAFQARVQPWTLACFNEKIAADKLERSDRAVEEMLELSQAVCALIGVDFAPRAHALVDYVASRPVGEVPQEVGGVMVTLAALCLAVGVDMHEAGEVELARINQPHIIEKIRAKQAAKPTGSALPIAHPPADAAAVAGDVEHALSELEGSDFEAIRRHAATLRAALSHPAPAEPVQSGDVVDLDTARLALFDAIRAIKFGNATDDKLILDNLRSAGFWICRLADFGTTVGNVSRQAAEPVGLREALKELAKGVFVDAATKVHYSWIDGTNGSEPDFGEAASDYAESFADAYADNITEALTATAPAQTTEAE